MNFTAKTIADFLKGEIIGNPDEEVTNISKIEEGKQGTLSFLANPKYQKYVYTTGASIVLVNKNFVPEKEVKATLIKVNNAYEAFASLLQLYEESKPKKMGISRLAFIDETASVGKNVFIDAFAYIGKNVTIGNNTKIYAHVYIGDNAIVKDNTTIFSGVRIYHECEIGSKCTIHAGTVIGSDGFGFAPQSESDYKKIPQIGNAIIEDNVEIGANVTIDRATIGSTIIRKGVKIDNLVQIAHNVEIGENTVIVAQVGIAGSTKIGRNCMIAGQVGIVGHLSIADGTKIGAQSGVTNTIKDENTIILGSPAFDISEARRCIAAYRKLPEMYRQVTELKHKVDNLSTG